MLYNTVAGDDIEIPSLEMDDEDNVKVTKDKDLVILIHAMGWTSAFSFKTDTGVDPFSLLNKFWNVSHSRVFIKEDQDV